MKNVGVVYLENMSCWKYNFYIEELRDTLRSLIDLKEFYEDENIEIDNSGLVNSKSRDINSNLGFLYTFVIPNSKSIKLKNIDRNNYYDDSKIIQPLINYLLEIYDQMERVRKNKKCLHVVGVPRK